MVEQENGGEKEDSGPKIQFVESIDKETEASLAAFLGKVTKGLDDGDAGPGLPDGLGAQLGEWMDQLKAGSFEIGGPKEEAAKKVVDDEGGLD
jgi:hypothetical protein